MTDSVYPPSSPETAEKRRSLAPDAQRAFQAFRRQVFADGALPSKVKRLIAVAVAHVTQCPYVHPGSYQVRVYDIFELSIAEAEGVGGGDLADKSAVPRALDRLKWLDVRSSTPTKQAGFCVARPHHPA